ncbi:MAG: glycosyltransferase family 2 protein [Actinomycetota bacterium]|nr:glycosyltransferase family 2 protein [Actinomycetota bacterium]
MTPRVDVVILTWNDGRLLDAAVASALGSVGVEVAVVVVDNGSEVPAVVADDERVVVLRNSHNRGVAAGRNQGVAVGVAPYVCFLDSDARLAPDCLAALVGAIADDPRAALTAPVFAGQPPEASAGVAPSLALKAARALSLRETYHPVRGEGPSWDVDFAIGACQLVRREALEAVGGLDESYFYGPEDVDVCLRLRRAGWRVVQVASASCEHPPRRRFRRLLTRRGAQHAWAVGRHLWRHRSFDGRAAA